MPGSKEDKKRKKAEVEAFKKAFKKQTGVENDSKDWGKLLVAFDAQVKELKKWTVILAKIQPDQAELGKTGLLVWVEKSNALQFLGKRDLKAAGNQARTMLPVLLKAVEMVRKKAKSKPMKQPVGDRQVSVYMTDIPGYADMAANQRQEAVEAAAAKTARGLELVDQIADGTIDVDDPELVVDPQDVEALLWALKSKAQDKNKGPYQKGAMTVPNGKNLRKFLDKNPQVYSRLSSHLREQQGRGVKGGIGVERLADAGPTPRGQDFYNPLGDDKPGTLPSGMNALLYQEVLLPNGEVALYVKMETEGSFGHPGDNRKLDPTVPADRPKHPNDGRRARKHLKNLLKKEPGDKDLPGLREQVPKEVGKAIKGLIDAVQGKKAKAYLKSASGTETWKGIWSSASPRICYFLDALAKCEELAEGGEADWALGDEATDAIEALRLVIEDRFPDDGLAGRRLGEEVVLTTDDFAKEEADLPEDDEDDLPFDDDEDEEGVLDRSELTMLCQALVEVVVSPERQRELQAMLYRDIVERQDDESFRAFRKAVGKSDVADLGERAGRLADLLDRKLQQL